MPEAKTIIMEAVIILILLLFVATFVNNVELLNELETRSLEQHELELNASWEKGWDLGYAWGSYDTFEETTRNGVYVLNETWVLYSPEGCLRAIKYEGCEVVCVTSSAQ